MLVIVHSLSLSCISLLHLTFKELSVITVDLSNLIIKSFLLLFVVLAIKFPHSSLLINVLFLHLLSKFLLFYLSGKVFSHSLLILFELVVHELVVQSVLDFLLFFKRFDLHLLFSSFGVHLFKNCVCHSSHEFLSTLLTSFKFLSSVLFLLK